jgi:hypothetical protein
MTVRLFHMTISRIKDYWRRTEYKVTDTHTTHTALCLLLTLPNRELHNQKGGSKREFKICHEMGGQRKLSIFISIVYKVPKVLQIRPSGAGS